MVFVANGPEPPYHEECPTFHPVAGQLIPIHHMFIKGVVRSFLEMCLPEYNVSDEADQPAYVILRERRAVIYNLYTSGAVTTITGRDSPKELVHFNNGKYTHGLGSMEIADLEEFLCTHGPFVLAGAWEEHIYYDLFMLLVKAYWHLFDRTQGAPPPVTPMRCSREESDAALAEFQKIAEHKFRNFRDAMPEEIFTFNLHVFCDHIYEQRDKNGHVAHSSELWVERMHQFLKRMIEGRCSNKVEVFLAQQFLLHIAVERQFYVDHPLDRVLHGLEAQTGVDVGDSAPGSIRSINDSAVLGGGKPFSFTNASSSVRSALIRRSPQAADAVIFAYSRAYVRGHNVHSLFGNSTRSSVSWQVVLRLGDGALRYGAVLVFLQWESTPFALISLYRSCTVQAFAPRMELRGASKQPRVESEPSVDPEFERASAQWEQQEWDRWTDFQKHRECMPLVYASTVMRSKHQDKLPELTGSDGVVLVPLSQVLQRCIVPPSSEYDVIVPVLWVNAHPEPPVLR